MKKIILFLLLFSYYSYGQVCQQTFSVSGYDNAPTILSVAVSDLNCYLGDVNSITISEAILGASNLCGQSYSFSVNLDGVVSTKCASDLIGMDISDFELIEITSANIGGWMSNNITISLTLTVDFSTTDIPYCNSSLLIPENDSVNTSATGELTWSQATGASGYKLSVGTVMGGTDVLNLLDVGNVTSYNIPGLLSPLTTYYVQILPYNQNGSASNACESYHFTTCQAFEFLSESFDDIQTGTIPTCWSVIRNTSDEWASINFYNGGVGFYNSGDITAELLLVTPSLPTLSNGTHHLKFDASSFAAGDTLLIGTLSDPSNPATFTTIQTIVTTTNPTTYSITFDSPLTDKYIAFKHGLGGLFKTISLDNFIWQQVPTIAPGCIEDSIGISSDPSCGNFINKLEWDSVLFADGYRLTMGTSEGGSDVFNNIDLGNFTSYSFYGFSNTEYFFTITPYNVIGDAVGCQEYGFVTAPNACYCEAVPDQSNFEGSGITNVKLGNSNFSILPITYVDLSGNEAVDLYQSLNANLKITFATGYTYDTHVWIDFNDDSNFTENERVFSGESLAANPTVFDASFLMPEDAMAGTHRMRIASANYSQQIPNPCYNGPYGVNIDIPVNILSAPSCLPPTASSVTEINSTTATLNWDSAGGLFNIEYSSNLSFTPGQGTLITGIENNSYQLALLEAETNYEYYVQGDCGDEVSPWFGPFIFRTGCSPFDSFTEDFNSSIGVPECWYSIVNSSNQYATVSVNEFGKNVYMTNSFDSAANLLLVTPGLTDLPNGTHRVRFKARASFNDQELLIGTLIDPQDNSTFSLTQTIVLTTTLSEYVVVMNQPTSAMYLAFKHGLGGAFRDIFIDDFVWEQNPTAVPDCTFVTVTVDDSCGNYSTELIWEPVFGADGYKLFIGTSEGASDVLNGLNLANATSYLFMGNAGMTYFYSVVPYNSFGDSVCETETFETAQNPCYCISEPTSLDGNGITNIQIETVNIEGIGETYMDFTNIENINLLTGEEASVYITFNTFTGFFSPSYKTNIWIDFNDDFNFDVNELVFTGQPESVSPTVFNASFDLSEQATQGIHRMRIASAISGQFIPNPCYSGMYGVTADVLVNIQDELKVTSFDTTNFKYYPNPVKDVLNISYSEEITDIELFNLLGQKLMSKKINSTQGQIDLSFLQVGNYLLKIIASNQTNVVKIAKR